MCFSWSLLLEESRYWCIIGIDTQSQVQVLASVSHKILLVWGEVLYDQNTKLGATDAAWNQKDRPERF